METLPIRVTDDGPGLARYRSPYSATHMGAQTDDYSTLSAQNYLMIALWLAYEATGEQRYLDDIDRSIEVHGAGRRQPFVLEVWF